MDKPVVRRILLRMASKELLSGLSRCAVICALLIGVQVFVSGSLGHLGNPQSAVVLASPMISPQQRTFVVVHDEEKS